MIDFFLENYKPGEADIQQELVSPENQFFVLHDSKGFEPGDFDNFETVRKFIEQRSRPELPVKERIHGIWYANFSSYQPVPFFSAIRLCTPTPMAGSRIFETGDEKLLQYANEMKGAFSTSRCFNRLVIINHW